MFNKKLFKDIKDRQQLRRKDNEMKNRQMKEMEENIRTLNEELEATKALLNGEEEKDNKLLAIDSKSRLNWVLIRHLTSMPLLKQSLIFSKKEDWCRQLRNQLENQKYQL